MQNAALCNFSFTVAAVRVPYWGMEKISTLTFLAHKSFVSSRRKWNEVGDNILTSVVSSCWCWCVVYVWCETFSDPAMFGWGYINKGSASLPGPVSRRHLMCVSPLSVCIIWPDIDPFAVRDLDVPDNERRGGCLSIMSQAAITMFCQC